MSTIDGDTSVFVSIRRVKPRGIECWSIQTPLLSRYALKKLEARRKKELGSGESA